MCPTLDACIKVMLPSYKTFCDLLVGLERSLKATRKQVHFPFSSICDEVGCAACSVPYMRRCFRDRGSIESPGNIFLTIAYMHWGLAIIRSSDDYNTTNIKGFQHS